MGHLDHSVVTLGRATSQLSPENTTSHFGERSNHSANGESWFHKTELGSYFVKIWSYTSPG